MPKMTVVNGAQRMTRGGVSFYRVPAFGGERSVIHAFSTRRGGVSHPPFESLNLGFKGGDDFLRVRQNRDLFARALGIRPAQFVIAEQVHGDEILEVTRKDLGKCLEPGGFVGKGDALITRESGLALMVLVADCMPILFYDSLHKAVGVAHAGWKGTLSVIAAKTLLRLGEKYGTKPSEVKVVLGPAIGKCCFEVGEDVRKQFLEVFPWGAEVFKPGFAGHWMLDLAETNARQLLDLGVAAENLHRTDLCTIDQINDFYSYRVEAGKAGAAGSSEKLGTGRIGAVVMLK